MKIENPCMHKLELDFITSFLNKNQIMLEYGSGWSTIFFKNLVSKLYSIEHSKGWFEKIKPLIPDVNYKHVLLPHADGLRCDYKLDEHKQIFKPYYTAFKDFNVDYFDVVFIDGRARAYCAKEILNYIDCSTLVFIHDYTIRDWYFPIVESYYKIKSKQKTMVLLQKNV